MAGSKTESMEDKLRSPSVLKSPTGASLDVASSVPSETPPVRRRFTKRTEASPANFKGAIKSASYISQRQQLPVETLGRGQVIVQGRRLRCRMCRRELAARQNILPHSPGKGQSAFATQKQDMSKFRQQVVAHSRRQEASEVENSPGKISDLGMAPTRGSGEVLRNLRIAMPPHPRIIPPSHMSSIAINTSKEENLTQSTEEEDMTSKTTSQFQELTTNSSYCSPPLIESEQCSSYFVEPLSWMKIFLERGESTGRITCPNHQCKSKLGSFDWAGSQCSCGAWITPGFQILRSKVDEL